MAKNTSARPRVSSKHDSLLARLQSITEHELTVEVLRPLFLNLGYDSVDYHGGPHEEGKDIICHGTDRFGDPEVTVVQIKKFNFTTRARAQSTFSELVTQLSQAAEKRIPMLTGSALPQQVIFVTPYPIHTRSLQSRFERYEELRNRNLSIIDGTKLSCLLIEHCPDIATRYGAPHGQVVTIIEQQLNNEPLLRAIHSLSRRPLSQFYTDIDFSLGRWTTKLFFASNLSPKVWEVALDESQWARLRHANAACNSYFGFGLTHQTEYDVISQTARDFETYSAKRDLIQQLRDATSLADKFEQALKDIISRTFAVYPDREKERKAINVEIVETEKVVNDVRRQLASSSGDATRRFKLQEKLQSIHATLNDLAVRKQNLSSGDFHPNDLTIIANVIRRSPETLAQFTGPDGVPPKEFASLWATWSVKCEAAAREIGAKSDEIIQIAKGFVSATREAYDLRESLGSYSDHPESSRYKCVLDTTALCKLLSSERTMIQNEIVKFNQRNPRTKQLRLLLQRCERLFEAACAVLSNQEIADSLGIPENMKYSHDRSSYRLSLSIHQVFDAGINLAVLGDAGAGKTTSLQMYASKIYELQRGNVSCLFIPLGRMVNCWRLCDRHVPSNDAEAVDELEAAIVGYLASIGVSLTIVALRETCRRKKSVLLLDGIDEAVKAAPWLLDAISGIARRYARLQVITSSRMMGDYLERVPFLAVTLLPFTNEQQVSFVNLWFGADSERGMADRVIDHLDENPQIREVVRNPLLATVMCELASHGIPLPRSEIRLYEDRVDLLTGRYDTFKGGPLRLKARRDDLVHVARKLAFWLHENGKREEDREVLYAAGEAHAKSRLTAQTCRMVVDELVDPCELLVPMTDDGKLGFGHLRYQEFLAAYELGRLQWERIIPLLADVWWRKVFSFYAIMEESIEEFCGFVARRLKRGHLQTLNAMVECRPETERVGLRRTILQRGDAAWTGEVKEIVEMERTFNKEHLEKQGWDEDLVLSEWEQRKRSRGG